MFGPLFLPLLLLLLVPGLGSWDWSLDDGCRDWRDEPLGLGWRAGPDLEGGVLDLVLGPVFDVPLPLGLGPFLPLLRLRLRVLVAEGGGGTLLLQRFSE